MTQDAAKALVEELVKAASSEAIAEDRGTQADAAYWAAERGRLAAEVLERIAPDNAWQRSELQASFDTGPSPV